MHLQPTPEQTTLREEAAAFSRGLRPLLEADPEWWRQGMLSDGDSVAVNRALGAAGWIGMSWPEELGGRGLSRLTATLVEEVFGYHWLPLSSYLLSYKTIGAAIERFGSPELVERLLPPIARGELVFCQGFSEPGAGSDLGSLTTRAERRGDTYVVSGHKIWTSSAQLADWIYLAVRTDTAASKHRGITVLVCPVDTPGIEVRPFPDARRRRPLRDLPRRRRDPRGQRRRRRQRRLGDPHVHARLRASDGGEGRRRRLGARRARAAAAGDRPPARRARARCAACEASCRPRGCSRSAPPTRSTAGLPGSATSAMAKLAGARLMQRVGDAAIDLLGLEGLAEGPEAAIEGRAAALYRASVGSTIAGGTAEVQQLVIARRGLGLR